MGQEMVHVRPVRYWSTLKIPRSSHFDGSILFEVQAIHQIHIQRLSLIFKCKCGVL